MEPKEISINTFSRGGYEYNTGLKTLGRDVPATCVFVPVEAILSTEQYVYSSSYI